MFNSWILAQGSTSMSGGGGGMTAMIVNGVMLAVILLMIAGMWRTFSKAGQPGWGVLIPIYNMFLMCKVAGRPGWWLVLMLVPVVNIVMTIIVCMDIAKAFGKGGGYGLGLFLLPFPFWCMLGFSGAQYGGGGPMMGGARSTSGDMAEAA